MRELSQKAGENLSPQEQTEYNSTSVSTIGDLWKDLIGELLGWILEIVAEALIEYVFGALLDLLFRAIREVVTKSEIESPGLARLGYVLLGGLSGGLSVFLFPHR